MGFGGVGRARRHLSPNVDTFYIGSIQSYLPFYHSSFHRNNALLATENHAKENHPSIHSVPIIFTMHTHNPMGFPDLSSL